jgi:hypothetical protein
MTKTFSIQLMVFMLVSSLSFSVLAQKAPMRYGRIDPQEFAMMECAADSAAKAVVLGDFGEVQVRYNNDSGWEYYFERHIRMKIFNKDAFDAANFKIYLHNTEGGTKDRLLLLKGKVYTPENGKIKEFSFKRKDAFVEEISPYISSVNVALPGINEGSIIELTYSIRSPFLYTLPMWFFQDKYPTVFSELHVSIPEYFNYKPLLQGFLNLDNRTATVRNGSMNIVWHEDASLNGRSSRRSETVTYKENCFTYRIENAPAFKQEPHMNAVINYLSKLEHELNYYRPPSGQTTDFSSTWTQLNKRLMESESFGRMLNKSGFLNDEIDAIKAKSDKPEERLAAAYQLIQSSMAWNQVNSLWAGRSLRKAWTDKVGNAADINLMLINMLRELDIEAHPVIISTRANGMINPSQIMLNKFNFVIAYANVDGKVFLMDATDKHTPYFLLPERCINGEGRLVQDVGGRWIKLDLAGENLRHTQSSIKVKSCGSMEVNQRQEQTNYLRLDNENTLRKYDREEDYMDYIESIRPGIELIDFKIENKDDWSAPLITSFVFEMNSPDAQPKDVIYVNPMLTDRFEANPFRLENREFPVDFIYPIRRKFDIIIQIPEGYQIDEMPQNKNFTMNGAQYSVNYSKTENNSIEVKVDMDIKKAFFLPTEYAALRNFYARLVEEQARNIVLKKI